MNSKSAISARSARAAVSLFGEVLFDQFPSGEKVLGGAPFNVAWHLQSLGDHPLLISRVGADAPGQAILSSMRAWGMSTAGIQLDPAHPTGKVEVEVIDQEPHYHIVPDCAYDFIAAEQIVPVACDGILYHGTLGLRNPVSRQALSRLQQNPQLAIFLDVNLRAPWWQPAEVQTWLKAARWVKLNQQELGLLGFNSADPADLEQAVISFQERFELEQVIVTRGAAGALVRTAAGEIQQLVPQPAPKFVDTVGAGDAFSAVYLHGLLADWSVHETLFAAQQFASKVVGIRGATTAEPGFYQGFMTARY